MYGGVTKSPFNSKEERRVSKYSLSIKFNTIIRYVQMLFILSYSFAYTVFFTTILTYTTYFTYTLQSTPPTPLITSHPPNRSTVCPNFPHEPSLPAVLYPAENIHPLPPWLYLTLTLPEKVSAQNNRCRSNTQTGQSLGAWRRNFGLITGGFQKSNF